MYCHQDVLLHDQSLMNYYCLESFHCLISLSFLEEQQNLSNQHLSHHHLHPSGKQSGVGLLTFSVLESLALASKCRGTLVSSQDISCIIMRDRLASSRFGEQSIRIACRFSLKKWFKCFELAVKDDLSHKCIGAIMELTYELFFSENCKPSRNH